MPEYVLAVGGVLEMRKIFGNLVAKLVSKVALEYKPGVLALGVAMAVVNET